MPAGLGITSKLGRVWPGLPRSFELHRYASLLGLGFAMIHVFVLLGDQYSNYSLAQLLVPFMGDNYRPEWVGFGQLWFYLVLVVWFSFYIRDRIGVYAWRLTHMLSSALFLMTLVHGVQSGTDSGSIFATLLYWGSAVSVLVGSVYRAMAHRGASAKATLAEAGQVITPGRAQQRPGRATEES